MCFYPFLPVFICYEPKIVCTEDQNKTFNFKFTTQRRVKIHKSANSQWSRYKQKWVEKVQSYNGEWSERLRNDDKTRDTYQECMGLVQ